MWRSSIQTPLFHGVKPTFAHTWPSASIARFAICAELYLFERCGVTGRESTSAAEAQDRIRRDDGPKPVPPTVRLDPEPVQDQHTRLCELWIVVARNADRTIDGDHDRADDFDPITTGSVGEIGEGDARFEVQDDQPGAPDVVPVVLGVWMITPWHSMHRRRQDESDAGNRPTLARTQMPKCRRGTSPVFRAVNVSFRRGGGLNRHWLAQLAGQGARIRRAEGVP